MCTTERLSWPSRPRALEVVRRDSAVRFARAPASAPKQQAAFARDERVGVPRVMPSRTSLCAPDVPRAIDAACTPHRAGGYDYVISASGRHQILETSATRAELSGEAAHAVHTNPYLSSHHYLSSLTASGQQTSATPSCD
jgi:hypothetical protein